MTITGFDKATCRKFGADLQAHIAAFARERGVTMIYAGGSFDPPMKFTMRLKCEVMASADGKPAGQVAWEKYATMLGLEASDFGRQIVLRGVAYAIVGLNVGRKRPILVERGTDGKRFQVEFEVAKRALVKSSAGNL